MADRLILSRISRSITRLTPGPARVAVLATALALAVAACGGGSGSGQSNDASAKSDPSAVFRFAAESATNSLDPQLATSPSFGAMWSGPAYEFLVRIQLDGTVKPLLATSWKMSADFLSMTFTLRDNVKFHDGTPFTAAAVKAVVERGKTLKGTTAASRLANIKGVDAVDDKTAVLNFSVPTAEANALTIMANTGTEMISPAAMSRTDLGIAPDGTGPYQIVSYNPANKVVYKRFDGWWGGTPKLAGIEITTVIDRAAAYNGLRSGQFDMVPMPADEVDAAKADNSVTIKEYPAPQIYQILLNTDSKFADLRVRQALSYAIDRDAMAKVTGSKSAPTQQYATPGTEIYDSSIKGYPYDPAKAKALLAEAGFPNGFSFRISYGNRPEQQLQAEALQQMLKKSNIDLVLDSLESATLNQRCIADRQCDSLLGPLTENLDFLSNFSTYGVSARYLNKGTIPTFLPIVQQALKTTNDKERIEQAKKVNKALTDQLPEQVFILSTKYQYATTKKVIDGFDFNVAQTPYWDTLAMRT